MCSLIFEFFLQILPDLILFAGKMHNSFSFFFMDFLFLFSLFYISLKTHHIPFYHHYYFWLCVYSSNALICIAQKLCIMCRPRNIFIFTMQCMTPFNRICFVQIFLFLRSLVLNIKEHGSFVWNDICQWNGTVFSILPSRHSYTYITYRMETWNSFLFPNRKVSMCCGCVGGGEERRTEHIYCICRIEASNRSTNIVELCVKTLFKIALKIFRFIRWDNPKTESYPISPAIFWSMNDSLICFHFQKEILIWRRNTKLCLVVHSS